MLELDNVTRQALSGYKAIQEAYTARKQYLRENKNAEVQPVNSNIEYYTIKAISPSRYLFFII
jgi:hypothetical protein